MTGLVAATLLVVMSVPAASQSPSPAGSVSSPTPSVDLEHPLAGPGVLPTDQAAVDSVDRIRTAAPGVDQVRATVELLASVGVGVVDQASGRPLGVLAVDPSPLSFLDWQVRAMALEAWAGSGSLGADLDAAVPVPDDAPLTSSLVAAWLASADTRAGRLGRALMAGQDVTDPTTLVVPGLVLSLLTADFLADQPPRQASGPLATFGSRAGQVAQVAGADVPARTAQGICTGATGFIDNVIGLVFDALKVKVPDSGVGSVLAGAWNWLVSRGQDVVRVVAGTLTEPVKAVIRSIVGGLAVAAQAIAAIVPYAVVVSADPASFTLPVSPLPPVTGSFQATVTAGDLPDWPAVLKDCAQAAGATLPSFRPGGEPVTWSAILYADGRVFRGNADATLDQLGSARLGFTSATEAPTLADGQLVSTTARVRVVIHRTALEDQARGLILGQLLGGVPDIIRPYLAAALQPIVDGLLSRLRSLTEARGAGSLVVRYHVPRESPTPAPSTPATAEPAEPADDAVWVHFERPANGRVLAGRILELVACDGRAGPWTGWLATGGLGPAGGGTSPADGPWEIYANDPLQIAFAYFPMEFQIPGGEGTTITLAKGTVDTPSWPVTFTFRLQVTITGDTFGIRQLNETSIPWYAQLAALPIEPAPAGMCP